MIPNEIQREHVLKAMIYIDGQRANNTFPSSRGSKGMYVEVGSIRYPPKYLISIAGLYASGEEVPWNRFISTEAIQALRRMGFETKSIDWSE